MRIACVALILLLPSALAQLPAGVDDPAAVLESMAASHHVPRNEGVQQLEPAAPTPPTVEDAARGPGPTKSPQPSGPTAQSASPAPAAPIMAPVFGPYGQLLADLEVATDATSFGQAMMEYYVAQGIAPAFAPPSRPSEFDENYTISYTYSLGDVNGDGVGDLMLDKYCPRGGGCPSFSEPVSAGGAVTTSSTVYGHPHLVEVISGADGRPIWNMSLDSPHPTFRYHYFASLEFTVGTVPMGDGTYGLLTYEYDVVWMTYGRYQIDHRFRLYEMVSGNVEWVHRETGLYVAPPSVIEAQNVVMHPHLDVRAADGPYLAPDGSLEALTLVGVGYRYVAAQTPAVPPSWNHAPIIVQDYQPDEWAVQLVPQTGEERWRAPTFTADHSRTVLPNSWWGTSLAGGWLPAEAAYYSGMVARANNHYWGYTPCCHDLDGDGHPELVYTTLEFTNLPNANVEGPYGFESRLVVFSGADGSLLYEHWLAQGHDVAQVTTRVVALGDLDADGDADFLVERMTLEPQPEYRWSIRSGTDGTEMWRIDNVRRMDLLIPGDVDGDGGNDILLIEWFQHEWYADIGTPYANVTHTPLKVFSGATGQQLWRRESYVAAADLDRMVDNGRLNGFPDLDGDGIQDIPIMDPIFLPDGTVIHRTSFYSPVTDRKLATAISAGAFAVPVRAGDINGDGREDFTLLNGDLLDMWVTTYDGSDGTPVWSRRLTDLRVSSAAAAIPLLRNHDIEVPGGTRVDIVVNFQMSLTTLGSYLQVSSNRQMVAGLVGTNGTLVWSMPRVYDADATSAIEGASPASALFADLLRPQTMGEALSVWKPAPMRGGLAFAAAVLGSFLMARRFTR